MNPFWSSDPLAAVTILVAFALFVLWLGGLTAEWLRLRGEAQHFRKLTNVQFLLANGRDSGSPSGLDYRDHLYDSFLKSQGVPPNSVAAGHIRMLHDAGWSDSRLDVAELNRHTLSSLFRWNSTLRSVLGLFIVIGLFGTLAGLSKALVPLSALDLASGVPADLSGDLRELLDKLKSAFAPSVTGVALTVLGVGAYTVFLGAVCAPLRAYVDERTASLWVPKLYPTTSQRILGTLEEANRQARENMDAAHKVAEFAEGIQGELDLFLPNVAKARSMLTDYESSLERSVVAADSMADAAEAMADATSDLGAFQAELQKSYTASAAHTEVIRHVVAGLDETAERLSDGIKVLRVFEDAYVVGLQEKTGTLLTSAQVAIEALSDQSAEIVRAVGQPVVDRLGNIDTTLSETMDAVQGELRSIELPLSQSVEQIQAIADSFDKTIAKVLGDIKLEFDRQNKQTAEAHEGILGMRKAMDEIANALSRSASRQDRLVEEVAAIARRGERPSVWSRIRRRFGRPRSIPT